MAKLQLSSSARKTKGLPVVDIPIPVLVPVEQTTPAPSKLKSPARPQEISNKKRKLSVFRDRLAGNKQEIAAQVSAMTGDEAQQRLLEVKEIIKGINRDLFLYKTGVLDIPKMIESGFTPKEWSNKAELARRYKLLERRLILIKLKPPKQEALDTKFNEIVRELESVVDVENSVIDNNPGNNL